MYYHWPKAICVKICVYLSMPRLYCTSSTSSCLGWPHKSRWQTIDFYFFRKKQLLSPCLIAPFDHISDITNLRILRSLNSPKTQSFIFQPPPPNPSCGVYISFRDITSRYSPKGPFPPLRIYLHQPTRSIPIAIVTRCAAAILERKARSPVPYPHTHASAAKRTCLTNARTLVEMRLLKRGGGATYVIDVTLKIPKLRVCSCVCT